MLKDKVEKFYWNLVLYIILRENIAILYFP